MIWILVEGQKVNVRVVGKTIDHYRALGYSPKAFSFMQVRAEHLSKGSHCKVEIICDYCGDRYFKQYKALLTQKGVAEKDSCAKCRAKKTKETLNILYGVDNVFQLEGIREKARKTILEKYGVEHISQIPEVREKVKKTNLRNLGVENPNQSERCRKKARETCLRKYGYENALQNPEIRAKLACTLRKNNGVKTSSQQLKIYDILEQAYENVSLNFPESRCILDIAVFSGDIKIDVEYDGWYWHRKSYVDRRRDEFLKSLGWKILRVKSGHYIPTEESLHEAINKLLHTDRRYAEIVLKDWSVLYE